jgi:hypothetical protein
MALGACGALCGVLLWLGWGRRFVLTLEPILIVLGVLGVLVGIVALVAGQPYLIWFPPLLLGGISSLVFGLNYPGTKNRYRQIELRKMQAADAE